VELTPDSPELSARFLVRDWPIDLLLGAAPDARLDWLSAEERTLWESFRSAERQRTFLAGRVAMKECLRDELAPRDSANEFQPASIHIVSRDTRGRPSRPVASLHGVPLPITLSLTHSDETVVVGLALQAGDAIGVDLTAAAPLGAGFQQTWFTAAERAWVAESADPLRAARLWSAKEAVYKAANQGEPFVPNQVEIFAGDHAQWLFRLLDRELAGSWTVQIGASHGQILAIAQGSTCE